MSTKAILYYSIYLGNKSSKAFEYIQINFKSVHVIQYLKLTECKYREDRQRA